MSVWKILNRQCERLWKKRIKEHKRAPRASQVRLVTDSDDLTRRPTPMGGSLLKRNSSLLHFFLLWDDFLLDELMDGMSWWIVDENPLYIMWRGGANGENPTHGCKNRPIPIWISWIESDLAIPIPISNGKNEISQQSWRSMKNMEKKLVNP